MNAPRSRPWLTLSVAAAAGSLAAAGYCLAVQQRWLPYPRAMLAIEAWHAWAFAAAAAAFVVIYSATRQPPR